MFVAAGTPTDSPTEQLAGGQTMPRTQSAYNVGSDGMVPKPMPRNQSADNLSTTAANNTAPVPKPRPRKDVSSPDDAGSGTPPSGNATPSSQTGVGGPGTPESVGSSGSRGGIQTGPDGGALPSAKGTPPSVPATTRGIPPPVPASRPNALMGAPERGTPPIPGAPVGVATRGAPPPIPATNPVGPPVPKPRKDIPKSNDSASPDGTSRGPPPPIPAARPIKSNSSTPSGSMRASPAHVRKELGSPGMDAPPPPTESPPPPPDADDLASPNMPPPPLPSNVASAVENGFTANELNGAKPAFLPPRPKFVPPPSHAAPSGPPHRSEPPPIPRRGPPPPIPPRQGQN